MFHLCHHFNLGVRGIHITFRIPMPQSTLLSRVNGCFPTAIVVDFHFCEARELLFPLLKRNVFCLVSNFSILCAIADSRISISFPQSALFVLDYLHNTCNFLRAAKFVFATFDRDQDMCTCF